MAIDAVPKLSEDILAQAIGDLGLPDSKSSDQSRHGQHDQ